MNKPSLRVTSFFNYDLQSEHFRRNKALSELITESKQQNPSLWLSNSSSNPIHRGKIPFSYYTHDEFLAFENDTFTH